MVTASASLDKIWKPDTLHPPRHYLPCIPDKYAHQHFKFWTHLYSAPLSIGNNDAAEPSPLNPNRAAVSQAAICGSTPGKSSSIWGFTEAVTKIVSSNTTKTQTDGASLAVLAVY